MTLTERSSVATLPQAKADYEQAIEIVMIDEPATEPHRQTEFSFGPIMQP